MTGLGTSSAHAFASAGALRRILCEAGRGRILVALVLLLSLRVIYLLACPLELVPDEAYYWDWSRQLDWGYYSKPPMVAWLIALSRLITGDSEFSIRLPAAVLGTLGLWAVYEFARHLYGHRTAVWAFAAAAASPGMTALCLLMTIDAPFLLAWTLSVYCLWRVFENDQANFRWVVPAIIATGSCLLAKQTAFGLFPLTVLFLSFGASDRPKLKSVSFWTWLVGSSACLLPMLWWNHKHGWITFEHTRHHFSPRSTSLLQHVTMFLEFTGLQLGMLSPVVGWLILLVTSVSIFLFPTLQRRERFLLCFGGLPMVVVTALSFFQRVQPNWPVALHLTGVILLAAWSCGEISLSTRFDRYRTWLPGGIVLGAVLSVALALIPFVLPGSPFAGTKLDPTVRLRGWRSLGNQIADRLNSLSQDDDVLVVAATPRGPVSELAYYLPGKPRVYRWNVGGIIDSQHDVWGGPQGGFGRNALIVTDGAVSIPIPLANAFATLDELDPVDVPLGAGRIRRYRVWLGGSMRTWPGSSVTMHSLADRTLSSSPQPSLP